LVYAFRPYLDSEVHKLSAYRGYLIQARSAAYVDKNFGVLFWLTIQNTAN